MTHSDRPIAPKFAKVPDGTEVTMARKKLVFGQTICQLEDSNHLIGDISALRQQTQLVICYCEVFSTLP